MIKARKKRIETDFTLSEYGLFLNSLKDLKHNYKALIEDVKSKYWEVFGINPKPMNKAEISCDKIWGGEIFITGEGGLLYYMVAEDGKYLETGYIGQTDESKYTQFSDDINQVLSKVKPDLRLLWKPDADIALKLEEMKENRISIELTPEEINAAEFLKDKINYNILSDISKKENILANQLTEKYGLKDGAKIIDKLVECGLANRDYVVICGKTGQQILRVSSLSAIEESSKNSFKCFICGKNMAEENTDQLISISEFGKKFLGDDYWFLLYIMNSLKKIDIYDDKIISFEKMGNIYCMYIQNNTLFTLIIFANKVFDLNDSFIIDALIETNLVKQVIIISTGRISNIFRNHLLKQHASNYLDFIDNIDNLDKSLIYHLEKRTCDEIYDMIKPFNKLTSIELQEILVSKYDTVQGIEMPILQKKTASGENENIISEKTDEQIIEKQKAKTPKTKPAEVKEEDNEDIFVEEEFV